MALENTLFFRLEKVVRFLKELDDFVDFKMSTKLGKPPIGFDDDMLQGLFWDNLHNDRVGFTDILKNEVPRESFNESLEVQDLITIIIENSKVTSQSAYEKQVTELVRLGLKKHIAELADIDESSVLPNKKVKEFLPFDQSRDELLERLNDEFFKYLIRFVDHSDLKNTVLEANTEIVLKMLA